MESKSLAKLHAELEEGALARGAKTGGLGFDAKGAKAEKGDEAEGAKAREGGRVVFGALINRGAVLLATCALAPCGVHLLGRQLLQAARHM